MISYQGGPRPPRRCSPDGCSPVTWPCAARPDASRSLADRGWSSMAVHVRPRGSRPSRSACRNAERHRLRQASCRTRGGLPLHRAGRGRGGRQRCSQACRRLADVFEVREEISHVERHGRTASGKVPRSTLAEAPAEFLAIASGHDALHPVESIRRIVARAAGAAVVVPSISCGSNDAGLAAAAARSARSWLAGRTPRHLDPGPRDRQPVERQFVRRPGRRPCPPRRTRSARSSPNPGSRPRRPRRRDPRHAAGGLAEPREPDHPSRRHALRPAARPGPRPRSRCRRTSHGS